MKISRKDPILIVGDDLSAITLAFALQKQGFSDVIRCVSPDLPAEAPYPFHLSGVTQGILAEWELDAALAAHMQPWERFQRYTAAGDLIGTINGKKNSTFFFKRTVHFF